MLPKWGLDYFLGCLLWKVLHASLCLSGRRESSLAVCANTSGVIYGALNLAESNVSFRPVAVVFVFVVLGISAFIFYRGGHLLLEDVGSRRGRKRRKVQYKLQSHVRREKAEILAVSCRVGEFPGECVILYYGSFNLKMCKCRQVLQNPVGIYWVQSVPGWPCGSRIHRR